jgi:transposase-like protein
MLQLLRHFFKKAFKNNAMPKKIVIDKSGSNTSALTDFNKNLPKKQKIRILQNKYSRYRFMHILYEKYYILFGTIEITLIKKDI